MKHARLPIWVMMIGWTAVTGLAAASATESSALDEMSQRYEAIRQALLADSLEGVADSAAAIEAAAVKLLAGPSSESVGVSEDQRTDLEAALREIEAAAAKLSKAVDLSAAREDFFALTRPMAKVRKLTGDDATVVAYCPMAEKAWIQPAGEIGNPYMGQEMPRCGQVVGE